MDISPTSNVHREATLVRQHFAEEMSKVAFGKQRLVIERHGKPLVAVVPLEDLALLEEYVEKLEDRLDVEAYRAAKAEMARKGQKPIPWEQVKRGLARNESRAEPSAEIVGEQQKKPARRAKRSV